MDENDMRKMDKEERLIASYYSIDHPINAPYYGHWKKPSKAFREKLDKVLAEIDERVKEREKRKKESLL